MGLLADTYVRVRPDTSKLGAEAKPSIDKFGRETADQMDKHGQNMGRRTAKGFNSGFSSVKTGVIGGVVGSISFGLLNIAKNAVKAGVGTAAGLEQAQIGFATLLKSGKAAQAFLGQLKDFAAKTPFNLPGLVDDARLLLGVGAAAKDVLPTLQAWGDTAGALGISQDAFHRAMLAVSQSMAAGKINAQDMNQIVQAGIPVWKLMAEALGKPISEVRKLSEQGKLLSADILPKLAAQMEKDYGGAMAKQSRTLTGLWSTFTDTVNIGLGDALGRLTPTLGKILPGATALAGRAVNGLATGTGLLVDKLTAAYGWLHEKVVPSVVEFNGWIRGSSTEAGLLRSAMAGAGVGIGVATVAIRGMTVAMWLFNAATRANPVGLVITAIAALVGIVIYAWTHFKGFREVVTAAWDAIKNATLSAWNGYIKPALTALTAWIRDQVIPAIMRFWHGAVEPAFQGIAAVVSWWWRNVTEPLFAAFMAVVRGIIIPWVLFLWRNVFKPAFEGIALAAQVAWAIMRVIFGLIEIVFKAVLIPLFMTFWHGVVEPVWRGISLAIKFAWDTFIHPVLSNLATFISEKVAPGFRAGVSAIEAAWNRVRDVAKVPVRFVIETVLNKGIIDTYNKIAGYFGVSKVDRVPLPFAAGGQIPGEPSRRDNQLIWAATGEYIMPTDKTRRYLPLLEAMRKGLVDGFADGGLVGLVSDPAGWVRSKVDIGGIAGRFGDSPFMRLISGMPAAALTGLVNWAKNLVGKLTSGVFGSNAGVAGGGGQLGTWIAQAMTLAGVPATWAAPLRVLIMRESGGDPRSINTTDINAARGDPSRGLMQTVGGTFEQYRLPGLPDDIYNPVANIVAGIRYILARYGSIFNVQQANPNMPPAGYRFGGVVSFDNGGYLAPRSTTLAVNGTSRWERVGNDRPGVTFAPTYNVAAPVNERELARETLARLTFALATGAVG